MLSAEGTTQDADGSGAKSRPGYEVIYFLNGAVGIGDYVKLECEAVTGFFRVFSIEMNGDNIAGDWTCTAVLLEED
jgi:hypothetical protein